VQPAGTERRLCATDLSYDAGDRRRARGHALAFANASIWVPWVDTAGIALKGRRHMAKVKVASFALSIDGFGAGPRQSIDDPLGVGGKSLMEWFFPTRTFQQMHGIGDGATGIDDDFAARSLANVGAWILGRNMFGPVRGPWPDASWKGWWGDSPPYHVPVFVLTHHARDAIEIEGGTTFHFVTDGIHAALDAAKNAAGDRDVRIGGGVETVRQYLLAGLVDEVHLALSPTLLGQGKALLPGIDMASLGFTCTEHVASPRAMHVVLSR
jgi:dihydrofolate reductase